MENGQVFGRGIDDLARIGKNADHAADIGRTFRASQRLNGLSPYASDVLRIGVINANDIIHGGLSRTDYRKAFTRIYGEQTKKALYSYTGNQYYNIQNVARGGQLANPGAHERTLMKVRRLDDLTNSHQIQSSAIFSRGNNMSREELAEIFNTGSLSGKNYNEIAALIKNKNTLSKDFTSANLPNTPIEQVNDWAIHGLTGRQRNNIIVVRELSASEGTRAFIVPKHVSMYSQDEIIFPRGLKTKVIDATPDIIRGRDGKIYSIIRTLEEVIP